MKTLTLTIAALLAINSFATAQGCVGYSFGSRTVAAVHEVRVTVRERGTGLFGAINEARPHFAARFAERVGEALDKAAVNRSARMEHRSTGCVGSCGVAVKVQATGCTGGGYAMMPTTGARTVVTVAPVATAAPNVVGGPFRDHRAIRAFLVKHGVPEAKLAAHEASVGGSANVDWLGLLMAFVKGGIAEVLKVLQGGG